MQLNPIAAVLAVAVACGAGAAEAQSLSPMHKSGVTPSDTKGFRLLVGNPYKTTMTFEVIPMEPGFNTPAPHATVKPNVIRLGAGLSRSVLVAFEIDADKKERTIGVCVQPKDIAGTILPRVCGTYTGVMHVRPGG